MMSVRWLTAPADSHRSTPNTILRPRFPSLQTACLHDARHEGIVAHLCQGLASFSQSACNTAFRRYLDFRPWIQISNGQSPGMLLSPP